MRGCKYVWYEEQAEDSGSLTTPTEQTPGSQQDDEDREREYDVVWWRKEKR